jgi:hypothetical protein
MHVPLLSHHSIRLKHFNYQAGRKLGGQDIKSLQNA